LPDAVRSLVKSICNRGKVKFTLTAHSVPEQIPHPAALSLYRVTQEALANMVKHSGSRRVAVKLVGRPHEVELTIRDFGTGFDPDAPAPGKLGLLTMEERVTSLGGEFLLTSKFGKGTTVRARIPTELEGKVTSKRLAPVKVGTSPLRRRRSSAA
jgi:signal transduction histidine kinase